MKIETTISASGGEEKPSPDRQKRAAPVRSPPADFIYDGGQIMLELLRVRAAEEERRRFVAALRRIDVRANREG